MAIQIHVSGDAEKAVDRVVPELVADEVASGITAQVPTLWGAAAEEEAAKRLGVAKNTVEKWRMTGRRDDNTPRFVKIGTAVRYDPDELDAWIERNSTYTTSEYDPYDRH